MRFMMDAMRGKRVKMVLACLLAARCGWPCSMLTFISAWSNPLLRACANEPSGSWCDGHDAIYDRLEHLGARFERGIREAATGAGIPVVVNRVGSMLTTFFSDGPVTDYASAKRADTARYARFFHSMLDGGVFLAPSQFEAAFVSLAHSENDLDLAAQACRVAMERLTRHSP